MQIGKKHSVFVLFLILTVSVFAQEESKITLDKLYKTMAFRSDRFGQARWLGQGDYYTTLEKSDSVKGGMNIVRYHAQTAEKDTLVNAEKLIPAGKDKPLTISNYTWSGNDKLLMIFTNTKRVWRRHTRGDYWVLDLSSYNLKKLGEGLPESSLMFAKFSPDDKEVAYVSEHNIYVESVENGKINQLTGDGSETIINGTFDWVYEEEFGLRDGFRWSPDGKKIAYWQLDAEGVGEFYMINNTDSIYSKIIPVQYPKVGTTNSAARVGVVSLANNKTVWMDVPGDPRNNYIAWMEWAANSDEIAVQHLNRLQNTNQVMLCSISDGKTKAIYTDRDSAWLDVNTDFKWLNRGKSFLWLSDKDGWRHLYIVNRNGKSEKLVTDDDFDLISILKIDDTNGWVYYMASPDNATQRYLFRVKLEEDGKIERLTPDDEPGTHHYQMSDNCKWAIEYWSNSTTPPVTRLVSLPEHKVVRMLVDNHELKEKISKLDIRPPEFFTVETAEGVEMDAWRILPPDFDSDKKYPVLFYVYCEPAGQTVLDRWGNLWYQMLAHQGYIIVSMDNRGTPAPKGRAWRKSMYGLNGTIGPIDQAAGVKSLMEDWDFIDPDRIGVWGWSGGGSSTLLLMFKYPDIYKTGMSVAPVTDLHLYDTIYEERYMGLPSTNPEGYRTGSAVNFADQLKGNLLIVAGTGDDNVHYQNTERLINELVKHNKQFTMMAYPNRSHSIYEGPGTRLHLWTLLTNYLYNNLPAGGK